MARALLRPGGRRRPVATTDPRIRALRTEFIAGLDAHPPTAIVTFPGRSFAGPCGRIADFHALAEILARHFAIAVDGTGYRVYVRRAAT